MNIQYNCVVVGGGAAGMMAAVTAARLGKSVLLIEHTQRLGSKLLQTGNGKCNFTNLDMNIDKYQNEDKQTVAAVLGQFGVEDTLKFFKGIGIYKKEKNGYVYPHSETAASLQDALRMEVLHTGVTVLTECGILSVNKKKSLFRLTTNQGEFTSQTLILATGSKAAPKTGSDGSGYALALGFGHTIKKPLPALVQLTSDNAQCKAMSGVRSTGSVTLYVDGKETAKDLGEIQYTDYGISGIPVFQISRYAVLAKDKKCSVTAVIDMLPDFSAEELAETMLERLENDGYKDLTTFFSGLLNKKLVLAVLKTLGINPNISAQSAGLKQIKKICFLMKEFSFKITGSRSFESAQVCQGGVKLSEINADTLESNLCPGLFFAGEVLDVDGKCGGYNLQWAWSSGYVAGKNAALKGGKNDKN